VLGLVLFVLCQEQVEEYLVQRKNIESSQFLEQVQMKYIIKEISYYVVAKGYYVVVQQAGL
jgi:hypothetical protein